MPKFLLRRLGKPSAWARAAEKGDIAGADMPLDLTRDLLPRPDEDGKLSVFEVEEATSAAASCFAAAFGFQFTNMMQEPVSFLAFDAAAVANAGLSVTQTPGEMNFRKVDSSHYEIHVESIGDLQRLAVVASNSEYIPFTPEQVTVNVIRALEKGEFDFARAFKEKKKNSKSIENAFLLLSKGLIPLTLQTDQKADLNS